jgi:hypothetical protein
MTIAVTRPHGNPLTIRLAGPSGVPSVVPKVARLKDLPSHYVATQVHKQVVDQVKYMQDTSALPANEMDYGVTEVPGSLWAQWLAQNSEFDVVRHKMVFSLDGA